MTIGVSTATNAQLRETNFQNGGMRQCDAEGHEFRVVTQRLIPYGTKGGVNVEQFVAEIPKPFPGNLIKAGGRALEATLKTLGACWGEEKNTGETPSLHDRISYTAASQAMHLDGLTAAEAIEEFDIKSPEEQDSLRKLEGLKSPLGQRAPNTDATEQGTPKQSPPIRGAHSLVG